MSARPKNRELVTFVVVVLVVAALGLGVRPAGLPARAWQMLLVAAGGAVLWMTEVVPLAITSLLIIVAAATVGALPLREGLSLVFHPVSAIVFAGFCLATALEKHGLDRRFSLGLVMRMGERTDRVVLGMMLATGLISTVISNSAATAIMIVIAQGLLSAQGARPGRSNLGRALMIGIPFAANIGGIGTPAGTPGNAITIALLRDMASQQVNFLSWMAYALPVLVILLPTAWLVLMAVYPPEVRRLDLTQCRQSLLAMGRPGPDARRVTVIFALTVIFWAIEPLVPGVPDWSSVVGLLAVVALSLPRVGVLTWPDIHQHTGWNIFLLIGGGLAMGTGLMRSGAVTWLAGRLTGIVVGMPGQLVLGLVAAATALMIMAFCTISGTATAMVPLAIGLASAGGWDPRLLAMAAGISASFAFLLPANSAPNALAYGSGYFKPGEMLRAGIIVMALGVLIVSLVAALIWPLLGRVL